MERGQKPELCFPVWQPLGLRELMQTKRLLNRAVNSHRSGPSVQSPGGGVGVLGRSTPGPWTAVRSWCPPWGRGQSSGLLGRSRNPITRAHPQDPPPDPPTMLSLRVRAERVRAHGHSTRPVASRKEGHCSGKASEKPSGSATRLGPKAAGARPLLPRYLLIRANSPEESSSLGFFSISKCLSSKKKTFTRSL